MTSETVPPPTSTLAHTGAPAPRRSTIPGVPALLLTLILLVAALLRFNGLNWDDGKLLHPDERHITDVITNRIHAPSLATILDPAHSSINPRSVDPNPPPGQAPRPRQFAYGSLPLFVTDLTATLWGRLTGENWNEFFKVFYVGRVLTVLFDLATIVLAFALARRAYGTVAGLLTAAFLALAVMPIQLAHFWVTDTWLTTFITAALLATVVASERGTARGFAVAGLLTGCAMATKGTAVLLAFPLAVALTLTAGRRLGRFLVLGLAAAGAAFVAFFLFEPYAVLDPRIYLRDLTEQSAIISGRFDVPYTRQYVGTLPLIYQAKNLLGWELGPLLGGLALAGFGYAGWRALRQRRPTDIVLLSWVIPYLLVLAFNEAKFMRYVLPVVPVLLAFGASLLTDLGAFGSRWRATRDARPRPRRTSLVARLASVLAIAVLLSSGLLAVAFEAIYSRPNTRIAASEWIYANVPKGAKLSAETWDDPLPLILGPGQAPGDYQYQTVWFDLYNDVPACTPMGGQSPPPQFCTPNTEATFTYLANQLAKVDYIVESSARLYGSIPRLPWRYPVQQQYYALLFAGRLGFVPVYQATSFPTLGPWTFNDQFMDESFTVYDHPRVVIFKRVQTLSRDELRALFAPALDRPLSPTRYPTAKTLLLDRLVDRLPAVSDYAWNATLGRNGVAAALLWLVTVELLGLLALPLALWVFRGFPDRGWGLSKLLGWLLLAYPLWLGASLRLGRFTLPYVLLTLVVELVAAALAGYVWRHELLQRLRPARRAILLSEGIFLAAWLFFLALRLLNPDLWHTYWGGEKPMELTHLNAILRSVNFPPYDPWYADGIINYYYFGQYLVAVLVKLTGIPVEIAFNLAMPTVSALLATAACSVAGALAARILHRRARAALPFFALLGALFFVGIGNLDGAARLLGRLREAHPAPLGFDYFWGASRAIDGAITEFPYFTQVWADLHAHVVALPFTLLAIGLAAAVAWPVGPADAPRATRRSWLDPLLALTPYLLLQALVLGALACTNSWDVPTYLLVTGAALFVSTRFDRGTPETIASLGGRLAVAAAGTVLTGLAAYALYLPFFQSFHALVGSLARTRVPTPLPNYLDHFGLFVTIVLVTLFAGLMVQYYRGPRERRSLVHLALLLAAVAAVAGYKATSITAWLASGPGPFQRWTTAPAGDGTTALLLAPVLVLLVTLLALAWREPELRFPLVLLIGAVGVTLGPEIVFIADDLQGGDWERMNTIFKFYLQGWSLYALGGLGALAWLYDAAPRWSLAPFRGLARRADRRFNAALFRNLVAGVLALLLLASFVYPVVATPLRVQEQFPRPPGYGPTLDGYRWMEYGTIPNERCQQFGFRDDYAAIRWLLDHLTGTPVIAEASIGPYRGNGSRFAIATGFPTILGWDRHEFQQRPALGIQQRDRDVRALYNSGDVGEKLTILQRYHVSFVVVGAVERHWYLPAPAGSPPCTAGEPYASPQGLAALEGLAGRYLDPVFRSGETVIYRVLPAAYSSGSDAGAFWAPR